MILFPAIDLVAGKVVRLSRGDRSKMDVYADDPLAVARDFATRGAHWIHVVDLSATFGEGEEALCANRRAIEGICRLEGVSVDVGGGVRSIEAIERLARAGARRIASQDNARYAAIKVAFYSRLIAYPAADLDLQICGFCDLFYGF